MIGEWKWEYNGVVHRQLDYLVEVDGDLTAPRLEKGKHDCHAWIGLDNLDLMMGGRSDGDRRLRDVVAKAVRTRLTARLRLEPIGPEHAGDLWRLHQDDAIGEWYEGRWTQVTAQRTATDMGAAWERDGVSKWIAYDRVTNELVGRGGLSRAVVDGQERLEVGWAVVGSLWGRGYATEIGQAALRLAFEDLDADEVVSFTEPNNTRSRAVMERLGMHYSHDILHNGSSFVLYRRSRRRDSSSTSGS